MLHGMTKNVYLDYNATTPLCSAAKEAMTHAMAWTGNASSIHAFGRHVRKEIEKAREEIADAIGAVAVDVTFTSGATEANNMVLQGTDAQRILYAAIEHPSIVEPCSAMAHAIAIPVLENGCVDIDALDALLAQDNCKALISVMAVNNETGIIQPIAQIAKIARKHNAWVHCDAVQALGRILVPMHEWDVDYLSLSAHKVGGPAGIGALVYGQHTPLRAYITGGGQERRRRAGTENVIGIMGFAAAVKNASAKQKEYQHLALLRDSMEQRMKHAVPECMIIGCDSPRVANTTQVILPGAQAEKQLMALDLAGVAVSSGSACSSGSVKPSHVLSAMGIVPELARCAIRISIGLDTQEADIQAFLSAWVANAQRFQKTETK